VVQEQENEEDEDEESPSAPVKILEEIEYEEVAVIENEEERPAYNPSDYIEEVAALADEPAKEIEESKAEEIVTYDAAENDIESSNATSA